MINDSFTQTEIFPLTKTELYIRFLIAGKHRYKGIMYYDTIDYDRLQCVMDGTDTAVRFYVSSNQEKMLYRPDIAGVMRAFPTEEYMERVRRPLLRQIRGHRRRMSSLYNRSMMMCSSYDLVVFRSMVRY